MSRQRSMRATDVEYTLDSRAQRGVLGLTAQSRESEFRPVRPPKMVEPAIERGERVCQLGICINA